MILSSPNRFARRALLFAACAVFSSGLLFADALEDWQKITALDAGPQGNAPTRNEARKLLIRHFDLQEGSLRYFISKYPGDSHNFEARMRLSHLLAIRGDLEGKPDDYTRARKILDDLESASTTPADKRADVAYTRVTLFMHVTPNPDERQRDNLMAYIRKFQSDYPGDHRTGALLAEMATLYSSDPHKQREMLDEAMRYASSDALKRRINDDYRRLDMLGRPLALKFDSFQGTPVDIADYRGRVVLIYFFANWAPPSVMGLQEVQRISRSFPRKSFQLIGISLDESKDALAGTLKRTGLDCPVAFDGKGWESPLARSLGVNALPTAWLVDRKGNLRVLDAVENTEAAITQLLSEKGE